MHFHVTAAPSLFDNSLSERHLDLRVSRLMHYTHRISVRICELSSWRLLQLVRSWGHRECVLSGHGGLSSFLKFPDTSRYHMADRA